MANFLKYSFSIIAITTSILLLVSNYDRLSNEVYTHLEPHEKRKLSMDYLSLGKSRGMGSSKSMRLLEKAARICPENEQVWLELSYPYLNTGMYEQWHAHMSKAIALNPQTWQSLRGYQKLHYFRDYGGALYDLDATDSLTIGKTDYVKNQSVDYLRGLCYLGLKNHKEATAFFHKYIKEESEKTGTSQVDPTAYIYLGIIKNDLQNYDAAIAHLDKALEERQPLADAYYHSAYSHFMLGQIDTASQYINLAEEKFLAGDFHKAGRFETYEVPFQLYTNDYKALAAEIACFVTE